MGKIQRDSIFNVIITYSGIALGFINKGLLFPLMLKVEQVGLINVVILLSSFVARFSSLGNGVTVMRFYPRLKRIGVSDKSLIAYMLKIASIGFTSVLLLYIVFEKSILSYFNAESALFDEYKYWLFGIGAFSLLYQIFEHYFRTKGKNLVSVILNDVILRILGLVLLVMLYFGVFEFDTFIIAFFAIHIIPGAVLLVYALNGSVVRRKRVGYRLKLKMKRILFSYGFVVHLNLILKNFILMIDVIMISALVGLTGSGVYTTMMFFTTPILVPFVSLRRIVMPSISQLWSDKDIDGINQTCRDVSNIAFLLTSFIFIICWSGIDILLGFFPEEYYLGKWVFFFLMTGKIVDVIGGVNGDILMISKKFKSELIVTLPLLVFTILLNLWLIPKFGIVGASIGTASVYLIYSATRVLLNYTFFKVQPFGRSLNGSIAIMALYFLLVTLVSTLNLNPYINLGISLMIGSGIIYLLKKLNFIPEELEKMALKVFRR